MGDLVLAFLLAATTVLPVVVQPDHSWGTSTQLDQLLALASSVPVAWRGRRPVLAGGVVCLAIGGCVIAAAPHGAAFQPFVALVLVSYSMGSRIESERPVVVR